MRPPTVTFTTRIYHPNVGIDGQVCLPIISDNNWKLHTKAYQGGRGSASREGPMLERGYGADFELENTQKRRDKNCGSQWSLLLDRRDAS